MALYRITNTVSGVVLGIYEADDTLEALDAMARDAGYADYGKALDAAPVEEGEIKVEELQ